MMEMSNDLKLCRLCLLEGKKASNIGFTDLFCNNSPSDLIDKIFKWTSVKITANDPVSKNVCLKCVTFLGQFEKFVNMCRHSDGILFEKFAGGCGIQGDDKHKSEIRESKSQVAHLDVENTAEYICDICNKQFSTPFDLKNHQKSYAGTSFDCEKCARVFHTKKQLFLHSSGHKVVCKICTRPVLPRSMSAHLLIHTDAYKCSQCDLRHNSSASLEKHKRLCHSDIKSFLCHICGKQINCQSSMNRHMGYHNSERPHKCQHCEFAAKSRNIVHVHTVRKHLAEQTVCEICAKIFKSRLSLVQHVKRIHRERKYVCNICTKAFTERYNLNKHMRRHNSHRLHECKICQQEFFTVRGLKEHMHSHREGCVDCPNCGKTFFYKKYYDKHTNNCKGNKIAPK